MRREMGYNFIMSFPFLIFEIKKNEYKRVKVLLSVGKNTYIISPFSFRFSIDFPFISFVGHPKSAVNTFSYLCELT